MTQPADSSPIRRVTLRQPAKRPVWPRLVVVLAVLPLVALTLYLWIGWPWIRQWGAMDEEARKPLPGDELIPDAAIVTTKAITIHAPPESIYPWLLQLGVDRGGMYSYLWVENWLLRLQVQNSPEIRAQWQDLQAGDFIRFTPGGYVPNGGPGFYVMALEPNRALTACFGLENQPVDCRKSGTWQFVLEPQADGSTRLLLRGRSAEPASVMGILGGKESSWMMAVGKLVHALPFYMERKMLLTIKELAEQMESRS